MYGWLRDVSPLHPHETPLFEFAHDDHTSSSTFYSALGSPRVLHVLMVSTLQYAGHHLSIQLARVMEGCWWKTIRHYQTINGVALILLQNFSLYTW